jgi:hypothetical protein
MFFKTKHGPHPVTRYHFPVAEMEPVEKTEGKVSDIRIERSLLQAVINIHKLVSKC